MNRELIEKLQIECNDLEGKIDRLGKFINENFRTISVKQQILLTNQYIAMTSYLTILKERIEDLSSEK